MPSRETMSQRADLLQYLEKGHPYKVLREEGIWVGKMDEERLRRQPSAADELHKIKRKMKEIA